MIIKWLATVVGLAVAEGLVLAGTAHAAGEAGSVRVERGQLIVQAASGLDNQITVVERDRQLWVSDVVALTAGAGCARASATQVSCASAAISSVAISTDDGNDYVRADVVDIATGTYLGDGDDTFEGGPSSDTVFGGPGDDHLYGGDEMFGGDFLYGQDGFDTINGGKGEDWMDGGPKNDVIDGFDAQMRDAVDYSKRTTTVKVDLGAQSGGETGVDEADTILNVREVHGGSGDDTLISGPKQDTLDGGSHVTATGDSCTAGLPSEGDQLVNCNP